MNLYLAGLYTSSFHYTGKTFNFLNDTEKYYRTQVHNYLESYHYINRQRYVDRIRKDGIKVFLDSGAFSAFTKGIEVDLPAYCEFIKKNQDIIRVASVLDGIGDPYKTYCNQVEMEKCGTRPLPCFHYGEDERYLEYYIENYEYITLGGMVPISTPQLFFWLDRIWDKYLTDSAGHPKLKVHGFGLTTPKLMWRYPWYSVDSSSWVQYAAFGHIFLPDMGAITVSAMNPARKVAGRHFDNLPTLQQEGILNEIAKWGFEIERLRNHGECRAALNCWAFEYLQWEISSRGPKTFQCTQPMLF